MDAIHIDEEHSSLYNSSSENPYSAKNFPGERRRLGSKTVSNLTTDNNFSQNYWPSSFPESGLIFVRSEDVLSMVSISITKQPYSTIGFFYKTSVSGKNRIKVLLVDIYRFTIPTWLDEGATIEDVIRNPLVSSIAIKGLNPIRNKDNSINVKETKTLYSRFRQAIGKVIGLGTKKSFEEIISQLFGYQIEKPTSGVTAVEMVNRVIMNIGKWDNIPQDGSLSAEALRLLKAPKLLGCDLQSKTKMIQILTSNFNQQAICDPTVANKLMQSYIVDNGVFGEIRQVPLPKRDPHRVRMFQEATYRLNSDYMAKAVSTFTHMLINDHGFYQTVVAGFNQSRIIQTEENGSYRTSLLDIHDNAYSLVKAINSWIGSGEIAYRKIISKLVKFDQTCDNICDRHGITLGKMVEYPILDKSKLLLLRKDENSKLSHHDSHQRMMVDTVMSLREEILSVKSQIANGSPVVISINDWIRSTNNICQSLGLSADKIHLENGNYTLQATLAIKGKRPTAVPLSLQTGKKIVLPLVRPNLSGLLKEELEEIIEALDNMASNDHRFDNLRSAITNRLSQF